MTLGRALAVTALALGTLLPAATAAAAAPAPWQATADVRDPLADAATSLALGEPGAARSALRRARSAFAAGLAPQLAGSERALVRRALDGAERAVATRDDVALEVARARLATDLYAVAVQRVTAALRGGDVQRARAWLLVRAFRPPTRFSRASGDATVALRAVERGKQRPGQVVGAVRADLLDTYQSLLREELDGVVGVAPRARIAPSLARAAGYWRILAPAYQSQRGAGARAAADRAFAGLAGQALAGGTIAGAVARARTIVAGFRAAPLSAEEQTRRAGQVRRFVRLVPVEYGRGVRDGQVTLAIEVQEAITFRDGAASAFGDLRPLLPAAQAARTARIGELLDGLGSDLTAAAEGTSVVAPDSVERRADEILSLTDETFPKAWREAESTADFDVIAATLDRLEAAVREGQHARAEQARLEAYAFFEFGPEQRLRGLAPGLFQRVEGLFWYGAGGHPGLVQLLGRKAGPEAIAATRAALDEALVDAQRAIGEGPSSRASVVANTAVIVLREGLEAVLILAVLMASMTGAQRRLRRPMALGAAGALVASAVTWVVAQTVLGSLTRYGEKLEALVSLVAIGVLLLILNWFFHKVYWVEHMAGLHERKRRVLRAGTGSVLAAPFVGLALLGFSSVYREGFETVLFLQALVIEAGTPTVLLGVLIGLAATSLVGFATFTLQQHLPYKRMLILTGLMVAWVLVVLVGTTVQSMQAVGWLPVSPVDGLELPLWAGLWLGLYPTWEGLLLQAAAGAFVIGSYFAAEALRKSRRRRVARGRAVTDSAL